MGRYKVQLILIEICFLGSVDPYETDEDPNYEPEEESERSDDTKLKEPRKAKKTKKRARIEMEWQYKKRKRLRDSGKEYVGFKKKVHPARSMKHYIHSCIYRCNDNIPEKDKIRLFDDFYNLPSYDLQNSFLSSCIKKKPVCRKKATEKSKSFITEMFMFCVKATCLQEVHHKFLEPGHTFMACDRDFGLIEKVKRKIPQVFIPEHWIKVIQSSCKKFAVHAMTQKDFYSFQTLNEAISDPKKDTNKSVLKWRQIQYFKFEESAETYSFILNQPWKKNILSTNAFAPTKLAVVLSLK